MIERFALRLCIFDHVMSFPNRGLLILVLHFDDCSQDDDTRGGDCEVESKGALRIWMIEKARSLPLGVFLRVSNVEAFTIPHLVKSDH